jgi:hypothetical protein
MQIIMEWMIEYLLNSIHTIDISPISITTPWAKDDPVDEQNHISKSINDAQSKACKYLNITLPKLYLKSFLGKSIATNRPISPGRKASHILLILLLLVLIIWESC